MYTVRNEYFSIYTYACSVLGLLCYLYGFFPINYATEEPADRNHVHGSHSQVRHIDKLAIIVIDSLRYDFVIPSGHETYMPFTTASILRGKSCALAARADSPTVTMPRIKALTSGTSSTYIDVILNLMAPHFEEDNFIVQAASKGLKLVFYGDNTWLKLFPNAFIRSEGTNSFFALDYTEVDNNVTRHIDSEFQKTDWDLIILHYLGLDHIGHIEGPKSPLANIKLIEMDNIVKKFHDHLKYLERKDNIKTMMIVTGDHGMKDSGGHGGVTQAEVTVPIVSVGNPCKILPGWPHNYTALQIDVAPTVSALLGLPIPKKSMGKVIPNFLHGMDDGEVLKELEKNRAQIRKFKTASAADSDMDLIAENMNEWMSNVQTRAKKVEVLADSYFKYFDDIMSQVSGNSNSQFKVSYLILGLGLLWTTLIALLWKLSFSCSMPQTSCQWFLIFGVLMHSLTFLSSSFIEEEHQTWYFLWITLSILALLQSLRQRKIKMSLLWLLLSCTHRILRKLNQTGDKWASLPDIKSYLNSAENQTWLFFTFLTGIGLVFYLGKKNMNSKCQTISFGLSLLCIVCFRVNTGSIKFICMDDSYTTRGEKEIFFFWIFFVIFLLQSFSMRQCFQSIWLLLGSLILRPHNVPLLGLEVLASQLIHSHYTEPKDHMWNSIAHVWLGNVFYFYQGNGNSLANVDVTAGFIGMNAYNPLYAGVMVLAHTFNGQILSFILSQRFSLIPAVLRLIPLTIYCTSLLFHLNHLFIWSVFSPKLLYEACSSVLLFAILLVNGCCTTKWSCQVSERTKYRNY